MIKILTLFLLSIFPLCFGTPKTANFENNGEFAAISIKKSKESDDFLSYWKNDFRRDENDQLIAICDITYADYLTMYEKYAALASSDRTLIDNTPDYEEGYTIKDSLKQLVSMYGNHNQNKNEKRVLNKSTSIIIIVVVAVFGMSTISVFFVLKNNKIID